MEGKYNLKSPAVKRLMKEAAELRDPTEHYHAQPLEDNLFEWHFSVRGPPDSDFDGGIYHGRIVLPPEYPMKPPSIILLTPNGRFEVGKKICLSISGHHPETWQPSWSIRTALIAIIGFMPTKGEGAIGSLDYTPEERKALAKKSQDFCCEMCGCSMRTALLALMPNSERQPVDLQAQQLAQQINFKAESSTSSTASGSNETTSASQAAQHDTSGISEALQDSVGTAQAEQPESASESASTPAAPSSRSLSPRQRRAQNRNQNQNQPQRRPTYPAFPAAAQQDGSHTGSAVLIVLLTLALAALVFRRIYLAQDYKFDYEL
ncbi:ubiquitin-conjugating enzyme E2 J1 [Clarias gariepinus]|uniref:ubiquitin-conjugating enzyme E2 J1 n=1 Tax=Clarias gariepinus TaxID=13013 RepID=UPI00234D3C33|nr:ubiquitin-conjugating enzyme E2 J1 [Clarias gariepinus]